MKKITLALSALALSAVAAVASPVSPFQSGKYVIVPADAAAQAKGLFLVSDGEKLAFSNDLATSVWDLTAVENNETFETNVTYKFGEKYLSLTTEGATMSTEATNVYASDDWDVSYAVNFGTNSPFDWDTPNYFLNTSLAMVTEDSESEAPLANIAWYCFEYTEETTAESITAELWSLAHPNARVIAVGSPAARNHGYFVAVDANGALCHTDTYDMNAVWDYIENEDGSYTIKNLGEHGGYLFGDGPSISAEPVKIYEYESLALPSAVGFNRAEGVATSDGSFLNASNQGSGFFTWSLDEGSSFFVMDYDGSLSADSVKSIVDAKYVRGNASAVLVGAFEASESGRDMIKNGSAFYGILNAKNEAALNEAIQMAGQRALVLALEDMKQGFVWVNVRTNQYMNYDATTQNVNRFDAIDGFNSLWEIEFVNGPSDPGIAPAEDVTEGGDETETPEAITFRIKNAGSGLYLGQQPAVRVPVASVANVEEAGVFSLAIGTRYDGYKAHNVTQLAFAYAGTDVCLNISDQDDLGLVIWEGAGDAGAAVSLSSLPSINDANVGFAPRLSCGGEYNPDFQQYFSINSAVLFVPADKPVTFTGKGKITLEFYGDEEDVVLSQWTSDALTAAEPVDTFYVNRYFDMNTWQLISDTIACKAYVLPLRNVETTPGFYAVRMDPYFLSMTANDGQTVYNVEGAAPGYIAAPPVVITPVVVPESGTVTELTSISFGDVDESGLAANIYCYEPIVITKDGTPIEGMSYTPDDMAQYMNPVAPWDAPVGEPYYYYIIPCNLTEAGTYEMTIPGGFFENDNMSEYNGCTVTWIIEVQDGISTITDVKVNGNAIYDLQGRRVAAPAKGVYIINGKKVLVK